MGNPKIKIKLDRFDYFLEIVAWIGITMLWLILIYNYKSLPEIIPTHYNLRGEVDKFGKKSSLILLSIVASVIFVGVSIVSKFPHLMNHTVEINNKNAERQYRISTRLLRILKIGVVIIFLMILYSTILHANKSSLNLGKWFLPSVFLFIFLPIFYFLIKASKNE